MSMEYTIEVMNLGKPPILEFDNLDIKNQREFSKEYVLHNYIDNADSGDAWEQFYNIRPESLLTLLSDNKKINTNEIERFRDDLYDSWNNEYYEEIRESYNSIMERRYNEKNYG